MSSKIRLIASAALFLTILSLTSATAVATPFEFPLIQTGRGLTLHKTMGILPFTYAEEYHGQQSEVIFQVSAKHNLFGSRFYVAYSQISFWQAYDSENSAPFRDTNYNPEIFYRSREVNLGSGSLGVDVGFEHESNGQLVQLSRSWNLLYIAPFHHGDNWLAYAKLRYRIPEEEKETPDSPLGDDNPDITDYLGYSDLHLYYRLPREHLVHLMLRGYLGADKGNISMNYSLPLPRSEDSFLQLRLFHGYGESLLDYRQCITRVGIGIMFNR
ncbi:MAG: phospholipase A [bacterium]|nr:phospholipase A [bacterium]